jgi:N4-gp56 family major capsid protein
VAATSFGVNDPLAVKLWSKKLTVEVLKETWIMNFAGTNSDSMVQIKDETQKSAGDKITYGLRMQLVSAGVQGDGTLEGNEESLVTYSDAVLINQLRNAVRSAGRMSQQRVPFSVRDEALSGLRDWYADRFDASGFNQLCGYTPQTNTSYTGNNATIGTDAAHQKFVGGAVAGDQAIVLANVFGLAVIDAAVETAKILTPAIRPVRSGGREYYLGFLHPIQVTDMRVTTSTGQWLDIQKAAMTGGEVDDNPIFDGSLGVYNGVILHSDYRVTQGVNSVTPTNPVTTVRRAVLAGAQALMLAYGRDNGPGRFTWVEELFDYENELGVSVGCIYGMKKTVFNSADFATVVMSSYAVAH